MLHELRKRDAVQDGYQKMNVIRQSATGQYLAVILDTDLCNAMNQVQLNRRVNQRQTILGPRSKGTETRNMFLPIRVWFTTGITYYLVVSEVYWVSSITRPAQTE